MGPSSVHRVVNTLYFTETRMLKDLKICEEKEKDSKLPFVQTAALYVAMEPFSEQMNRDD